MIDYEKLKRIEEKRNRISSYRPLTKEELERLREDFCTEYTYNSNAIEGNSLTERETYLVLQGITIGEKPLKDHLDIIGHKEAFDYICTLVKDKKPLTEWEIKQIHFLVLFSNPDYRGIYRDIGVRISGAPHTPPEPYLIPKKMEELLLEYNQSKLNIIEKIARFHVDFESIHPFIDGNGRTGRLLMNFELMKNGFPPIDIKYESRKDYYNAFESKPQLEGFVENNAEKMTELIADKVETALDKYLSVLKERERLINKRELTGVNSEHVASEISNINTKNDSLVTVDVVSLQNNKENDDPYTL